MIAFSNAVEAVKFSIRIQYGLMEVDWPSNLYWSPESNIVEEE
jgi:hypothetical protein